MTDSTLIDALAATYAGTAEARVKAVALLKGEGIPLSQAKAKYGVHPETARRWCVELKIGQQWGNGARWTVSEPALRMVIDGNWQALRLFRHGAREDNPIVSEYL